MHSLSMAVVFVFGMQTFSRLARTGCSLESALTLAVTIGAFLYLGRRGDNEGGVQ